MPPAALAPFAAWLPAALALGGVLGPALLARGTIERPMARAMALAALVALAIFGTLSLVLPLPSGSGSSRLQPALDALAGGALVALAAVGMRRMWAFVTLALAAALIGRAAFAVSSAPTPGDIAGAALWVGAAILAAALAAARFRLSRPA